MTAVTYVITRLCRDCVDSSCVSVCPIPDCIVEHRPSQGSAAAPPLPNQLFINPDACIACGACEPECPWNARVAAAKRINGRFFNTDPTRLPALLVEFVCSATGGPCQYTGRDMRSSHAGMQLV